MRHQAASRLSLHGATSSVTTPIHNALANRMTIPASNYQLIYATVRQIPKGRVATYGQVAQLAGLPRQARLVGYALNSLPSRSAVPWHRVVNAQGRISLRSTGAGHDVRQQLRLQREGVRFTLQGVIDLDKFQWRPKP